MKICLRWLLIGGWLVLGACGVGADAPAGDGPTATVEQSLELTNFGSNPGGLKAFAYVPPTPSTSPALVVALHGCTQTAAAYESAGWNAVARRVGFYVLYPEVQGGTRCFGWFDAAQTRRGAGQALSIKQAVEKMITTYGIDRSKIFVTGLSAGGGMTAAMLATYPDVFSAGAIMAGLPYRCADSLGAASGCQQGTEKTPQAWGDLARAGFPGFAGPWPRVSIWSGNQDFTVNAKNLTELMEQWTNVHGIDTTADATATQGRGTRRQYADSAGVTRVDTWTVTNMGHGTAVAPAQGCGTAGAFILDVGLCSTELSAQFFGLTAAVMPVDAGTPAPVDAGTPAPVDAGTPTPVDAGTPAPVDAGTPAVDAGTPPGVDAGTGGTCRQFEDNVYNHTVAGRAVRCGSFNSYACANGSGENLGLWNTFNRATLKSTNGAYWSKGSCP